MAKILLVEDEVNIASFIERGLQEFGHEVCVAYDGMAGWELLQKENFQLLILDIIMPKMNGLQLCRQYRQLYGFQSPVIMLTALGTTEDIVNGLDAGADDYLIKPYDLDELSARIRALLRRSAGRSDPIIRRGRLTINPSTREVLFNGESVLLSSKEYALLFALAERPGIVLSRAQLEEKLYNYESLIGSNAIEVHIHHLRKKLSEDSIKTVRGVGYVLET